MRYKGFVLSVLFLCLQADISYAAGTKLWDRMCAACHDGTTVLNGRVVIDKGEIKKKYKTIDELVDAVSCKSAPCMNILKHDEKLVRNVGKEMGLK